MKTGKVIIMGILPSAAILLLVIFVLKPDLYGQDDQAKKGQPDVQIDVRREYDENGNVNRYDSSYSFSWSYDGSMDLDSLFESLRNNFNTSPFDDDEFYNRPHGPHNHFRNFPWHREINPETDGDTLYEYIHPDDSTYSFREPYDFFGDPFHGIPFNDTLFDEFFDDPFFKGDPRCWPEFDMRSMMENHRKMMEEMHKHFEFNMPRYPLTPDSIPRNPLQQRYFTPPKPLPKGQEI